MIVDEILDYIDSIVGEQDEPIEPLDAGLMRTLARGLSPAGN